ncbi:MAG: hypothetical protein L0215_05060 [Gemmataceae bacterium]|nr:hypothetical protein [Gemmataceae bacterium]
MRTWGLGVFVFCLLCCPTSAQDAQKAIAEIKTLSKRMEKEGTEETVSDFFGGWQKRRYFATEVKYDVKKTDSLIAPFTAEVSWMPAAYITQKYTSKKQAEKAALPKKPNISKVQWHAKFRYEDAKWVLQDVWWYDPMTGKRNAHSKLQSEKDPIMDWWLALGGKPSPKGQN